MRKQETYAKTVRFPADLYAWIDAYGPDDFSKNLMTILREYKNRKAELEADIKLLQERKLEYAKRSEKIYKELSGLERTKSRVENVNRQLDTLLDDIRVLSDTK